ncbi:endonuclease/exonuclease/phosphatase family protein [Sphingobacterium hotanense]|uniref:endonuclease/exonuclease/phosphatase family protein n=1 Tax=Sphingobacterium hotanense TaxID=649196 RepID=UPI0021A3BCCA|nr:endonuclease/exonuclease/phosphatase family protein [Sphingobacterium hotanense]MCT1523797.1 hypothetical protein [Sphingobacterium hotanense]
MKISLSFLCVLILALSSCSKAPWESYTPPIDPNAQTPGTTDPDDDEEDPGKDPNNIRIISVGINNRNADYDALANLINSEEADLVVLREVDKNNTRTGIDINQAEVIADRTGMQYVFAPQLDNYNQGQFGLAVLSRLPIEASSIAKLPVDPTAGGDQRPLAYLKVNFSRDIAIAFIGVHLDDSSVASRRAANRPLQSTAIVNFIKEMDIPVFVAGNFFFQNEGVEMLPPLLTNEVTPGCRFCEPTVTQHGGEFIADHILYKNISVQQLVDYRLGPSISSRRPAIAEFKIVTE